MDFNPTDKPKTFEMGLYPPSLREETKNFSTLESYVYVISKKFNPFSDSKESRYNKPIHLVNPDTDGYYTKKLNGETRIWSTSEIESIRDHTRFGVKWNNHYCQIPCYDDTNDQSTLKFKLFYMA